MDKETISKYRAEVIEKSINIECIINAIISQHYLHKVMKNFYLEVLYDEYFTFALKRRILEKIIIKKKKPNSQKIQALNRLNTIRNYFAHCNQEIFEASDKTKKWGKIIDPRRIEREIDFESLYSEFVEKEKGVTEYLAKLFQDLGGVLEKE